LKFGLYRAYALAVIAIITYLSWSDFLGAAREDSSSGGGSNSVIWGRGSGSHK
jgi:hypothetical protein